MNNESSKAAMIALVEEAFADVQLGNGVSLRETLALDSYCSAEQRQLARQADETHDWRGIVGDTELARLGYIGGLAFYDAEGMRFHLPAYLVLALTRFEDRATDNVLEVLMHTLTTLGYQTDERFSLLARNQRVCVGRVLAYLRDTYELESGDVDTAIAWWLAGTT